MREIIHWVMKVVKHREILSSVAPNLDKGTCVVMLTGMDQIPKQAVPKHKQYYDDREGNETSDCTLLLCLTVSYR